MLKVGELFAGIGSQTQALKNIGIDHRVAFISEIDKYAIKSYEAIHGKVNNLGDIKEIEKMPYVDLLTYSFPCQDLSVAGKQAGIKENTRSGLLYEVERLLKCSEKPKYLLLENVKNLVGKKHKANFDEWLKTLESMGYNNYWQVLNGKDYGIPQNRERVFVVSIRNDILNSRGFEFPIGFSGGDIITYTLQKQVRKRKNTCVIEELKALLKESKKESGLTINQIKNVVNESKTLVEHWFRGDSSFSIPEAKNWFVLKDTLKIKTDKFDKFITEFEISDGVYEKANRIYDINGICPTLTTVGVPEIIDYVFPEKEELKLKLKDMLESEVDERFYIKKELSEKLIKKVSEKQISKTIRVGDKGSLDLQHEWDLVGIKQVGMLDIKGNEQIRRVYDENGISPTLNTMQSGNRQPKVIILDDTQGFEKEPRLYKNYSPTIRASRSGLKTITHDYKIRKLTPLECWRLMGFKDEQFKKAENVNSDSQLYKQAGNSIVVDVLENIFTNLFINELPVR